MLAHVVLELLSKARYHSLTRKSALLAKAHAAFMQLSDKAPLAPSVDWKTVTAFVDEQFEGGVLGLWELDVSTVNEIVELACGVNPGFSSVDKALASFKEYFEYELEADGSELKTVSLREIEELDVELD